VLVVEDWQCDFAIHVHKQWGLGEAVVMEALSNGCTGIWCSVAEEGAALGHTCSAVTIASLARLGNQRVQEKFNTAYLAKAAQKVTQLVTGKPAPSRQIVYGPRAVDAVFDFPGEPCSWKPDRWADANRDGVEDADDKFTLAAFLGFDEMPIRITLLSTPEMVIHRLTKLFGQSDVYTPAIVEKMLALIEQDLIANRKEDYSSPVGLAVLLCRAVGKDQVPSKVWDYFNATQGVSFDDVDYAASSQSLEILVDIEQTFRDIAAKTGSTDNLNEMNPRLDYPCFYHAFLQEFFGCFTCPCTVKVIDALDRDDNERISWFEWRFWLIWALREHGETDDIRTADDLIASVVRRALLPTYLATTGDKPTLTSEAKLNFQTDSQFRKTTRTSTTRTSTTASSEKACQQRQVLM
jgi:hypothetical protein